MNDIEYLCMYRAGGGPAADVPIWNSRLDFEMKLAGYRSEVIPGWAVPAVRFSSEQEKKSPSSPRDCVATSLRRSEATEAIPDVNEKIEIAAHPSAAPEKQLNMGHYEPNLVRRGDPRFIAIATDYVLATFGIDRASFLMNSPAGSLRAKRRNLNGFKGLLRRRRSSQ